MAEIDLNIVARLFRIKKNQLKMLERRGYDISKEKRLLMTTVEQFADTYINHAKKYGKSFRYGLTNIYENNTGEKILVYYTDVKPGNTQLTVDEVNNAIADMTKSKIINLILISPISLSAKALNNLSLPARNIQIFLEEEIAYDPTEHFLVPKHIPLTREEQQRFLHENNLDIDQLPIISSEDTIAKYYGMRPGQIVKIERENMFETMTFKSTAYKVIK